MLHLIHLGIAVLLAGGLGFGLGRVKNKQKLSTASADLSKVVADAKAEIKKV